jgi:predicted helicase
MQPDSLTNHLPGSHGQVMERQGVSTRNKDNSITNDANTWALETLGNPHYPLGLFQHVITVSLETAKIVKALPGLAI